MKRKNIFNLCKIKNDVAYNIYIMRIICNVYKDMP